MDMGETVCMYLENNCGECDNCDPKPPKPEPRRSSWSRDVDPLASRILLAEFCVDSQ